MQRITHNLIQGSAQWHEYRTSHYGASDAPAMMGQSKYRSRADLLREKATGVAPEISDSQQALFNRGHAAEVAVRPAIETMLGDDLYPVTISAEIDGLPLSASLDGLNLGGDIVFECKLWNESLAEHVRAKDLEPHYYWQLEQQLLVSGARRVIFATGDGAERLETMYYEAVPGRAEALLAGWAQFKQDVAAYHPEPVTPPAAVGRAPETLPALRVEAQGMVTFSNLTEFRTNALTVLGSINRDLKTDDDFADAESTVKWCKGVEDRLDAAKANVLAQMQSVDEVCRTIDNVSAETRKVRLELDRLVKTEKEHRRAEIVAHYQQQVRTHLDSINATLGRHALPMPAGALAEIGSAIKGRKTLGSITDAADTACANLKIAISQTAERVRQNIAILDEHKDALHLFADAVELAYTKQPDDLRNLIAARIAEHQRHEAARLEAERARIRAEEAAKLERQRQAVHDKPAAPAAAPIKTAGDVYAAIVAPGPGDHEARPIKLGDINARIAPLSISADGLAQLGFRPVGRERAAKLYAAADLPAILQAMIDVLYADHAALRKAG